MLRADGLHSYTLHVDDYILKCVRGKESLISSTGSRGFHGHSPQWGTPWGREARGVSEAYEPEGASHPVTTEAHDEKAV